LRQVKIATEKQAFGAFGVEFLGGMEVELNANAAGLQGGGQDFSYLATLQCLGGVVAQDQLGAIRDIGNAMGAARGGGILIVIVPAKALQ
jgi:hypothetical protein